MRSCSLALMALCLLVCNDMGHAASRTLLQDLMAPAPAPSVPRSGAATSAPVTSLQGGDMGSDLPPTTTPAPIPSATPDPAPTTMPATTSTADAMPPPAAVPYCTADIRMGVVWSNYDGSYMGVINIYMVNYGSIDIPTPWTFSIMNPHYLEVFQTWNWNANTVDSNGNATGYANQYWETIMASGQNQVNIGAIFKGSSPQNFYPRAITVNGTPCFIQQLR